ncbi:hypothetical protein GCM10023142_31750 [Anaerocolumna aminovalerica]|jgi:putative IMPACT (imprinted ancient) family translation regulator|uniref:Uncharacterized protein n=1 Tax=Anaerocolumna aminovalerica TaxID=1527 RepID=A0A1I5ES26_9FIRM|nr:hypothetical protein [Anaerocolumna aminovalerica]MBU5331631.1 hypothetical protein [Anaerocolumna aminovalerica]MDU6265355.1 hypothetical protein [Anaerocolumna aminovalerica]SFO14249.1 hypothetical protein SAMN04489757_110114 [Anaerocolumna aminovalerica]
MKIKFVSLLVMLFVFTLSTTDLKANTEENIQPSKFISIEKSYDNWDEAKKAGEYIHNEQVGLLKFKCAYRIGNTDKFKVTYVSFNGMQ